jgi:predicted DsbA family dithiol-disulfide isomerase
MEFLEDTKSGAGARELAARRASATAAGVRGVPTVRIDGSLWGPETTWNALSAAIERV